MECPACGTQLPYDAQFCSTCGRAQSVAATGVTQRLDDPYQVPIRSSLRTGICPQCDGADIYVDDCGLIDFRTGNHTVLNLHDSWFGKHTKVLVYLCTTCGAIELGIDDMTVVPRIKKTWTPLTSNTDYPLP